MCLAEVHFTAFEHTFNGTRTPFFVPGRGRLAGGLKGDCKGWSGHGRRSMLTTI